MRSITSQITLKRLWEHRNRHILEQTRLQTVLTQVVQMVCDIPCVDSIDSIVSTYPQIDHILRSIYFWIYPKSGWWLTDVQLE